MTQPRIISADELADVLQRGAIDEFWNVLTDDYFTGELIPGSRRVPLDRVGREAAATGVAKDAAIVVYCSGPTCPQSGQAAQKLATLGYTNVRLFEGGLAAWKQSGRSVERAEAASAA
jgi:rhodanese-related sulfurtransferase